MTEINTNYIFANETFSITEDVYFTVDTTVIHGHRVCKLKTLKIFYHGEEFEMNCKSTIYKYIITDGLQSIFSVELINYLNRYINHDNLYEVYYDNLKPEDFDQDSSVLWSQDRDNQQDLSSFILHDKSNEINSNRYKEGLIQNSLFIKSELNKLRNSNYPTCYSKYNEIKNIPIFCYAHPSLAINQGNTIILCHIEYILEKLANYKRFPEFNTQAVVSFLNVVSESARTNKTVEIKNQANFEIEVEKLQNMYLKKKEKCKSLKNEIAELKELMRNVNQSNIDLKQEISGLHNKIDNQTNEISDLKYKNVGLSQQVSNQTNEISDLKYKNDGLNQQISNQTNEITGLRQQVSNQTNEITGLKYTNKDLSQRIEKIILNSCVMAGSVLESHNAIELKVNETLPKNSVPTLSTKEVFMLINRKSLNDEIRSTYKLTDDYLVLDSISCQKDDKKQHLKDHKYDETKDTIIFESEHSNSLDFNKFVQSHGHLIIPLSKWIKTHDYRRKFIIKTSGLEELLTELNKLINDSNKYRNDLLIMNQRLINGINQPLINISESIPEDILGSKIDISSMLNKIREDIKNNNEKLNKKIEESKLEINQKIEETKTEINQKIEDSKLELIEIMRNPATEDDLKLINSENPRLFILINRRYREIFPQENGTFIYHTRIKNGEPVDPEF